MTIKKGAENQVENKLKLASNCFCNVVVVVDDFFLMMLFLFIIILGLTIEQLNDFENRHALNYVVILLVCAYFIFMLT